MDKSKYNDKCPNCGEDCYRGLVDIECSNRDCKFFREHMLKEKKSDYIKEQEPNPDQWQCDPDPSYIPPPQIDPSYNPNYGPSFDVDGGNSVGPHSLLQEFWNSMRNTDYNSESFL